MDRRQHLQTFASLGLLGPSLATGVIRAQDAKPDRVKFSTCDGVTLEGSFYPGNMGKKGSTFLFLHQPQLKANTSTQANFAPLAEELAKKGHSSLLFDFRGYGNSTSVSPDFWNLVDDPLTGLPGHPHNKLLGQSLAMRRPANISASYFPPKYLWALVNDIAAAKVFLDERNDRGDCNSSSLYVVAEGEACALASLWMASQYSLKRVEITSSGPIIRGNVFRPRITQNDRITKTYPVEGLDLMAGIWLGYKPSIGGLNAPAQRWLAEITSSKHGKNRTQMMFLYGAKDNDAKSSAKRQLASIRPGYDPEKATKDPKPGDKPAPKSTGDQLYTVGVSVPDCNMAGSKMLRPEFSTQSSIVDYVAKMGESRAISEAIQRNNRSTAMVWQVGNNPPVLAKTEGEQTLRAIPLTLWGGPTL